MATASFDDTKALLYVLKGMHSMLVEKRLGIVTEPVTNIQEEHEDELSDDENQAILEIERTYKMKDLKEEVKKNHLLKEHIVGNKTMKRTWSKALHKSTNWGFNTFVVGVQRSNEDDATHSLKGQVDVMLTIQKFM